MAALLGACGSGSSSNADEPSRSYQVRVADASFPTEQDLGQTSLLRLEIRNTGEKAVPMLTVTASIAGKQGSSSTLPFGVRERQPGLAQPDRPVWVLAPGYPKLSDVAVGQQGGATTANAKTFSFGSLAPGATATAIWKLSAVKAGDYTLLYRVGAGLGGKSKAETEGGVAAGGSFAVEITAVPPNTEVTDSGEVVEIQGKGQPRGDRARVVPRGEGE